MILSHIEMRKEFIIKKTIAKLSLKSLLKDHFSWACAYYTQKNLQEKLEKETNEKERERKKRKKERENMLRRNAF